MIRIGIVGPESTGKTTLCELLAKHYSTEFVPEAARKYLENKIEKYVLSDIEAIAKLQIESEKEISKYAKKYLFCDTTLLVTKIWAEFVFNKSIPWIEKGMKEITYDFYFMTDIDFPWTADPLREHPTKREELRARYIHHLENLSSPYYILKGSMEERLNTAIQRIELITLPE